MKVKDLIELNGMITDLEITVRKDGNLLLDQLNIGPSEGVVPPYPTRVPKEERFAGSLNQHNDNFYKDAAYIPKSINAWDDGKDYYEIKVNRIPAKWLDLEVHSWEVWNASAFGVSRRMNNRGNFHGQLMKIVALPSGEKLITQNEQNDKEVGLPGQMNLIDYLEAIHDTDQRPKT